jgi:uncharacterized alpha-E superfamily protein
VENLVLESVLIAGESIITHRRRHQGRAQVATVLDLLLLDRQNPRSVALQLDKAALALSRLPAETAATAALGDQLRTVTARVREADTAALAEPSAHQERVELLTTLDAVWSGLADLAMAVELAHFAPLAPPRPISATPGWDA